jgi:hypothetical protein
MKSLENDFVILITPAIGINDKGSGIKLQKYLEILIEEEITNIGDVEHGSIMSGVDPETFISYLEDGKRIRASISDKTKLTKIIERFKREDLGLSITVSGLIDKIFDMSKELGITPHTINMSLGVWGKKELLPSKEILAITTMCGHHMISKSLVTEMISKIQKGKISPEKATEKIGKLCVCGIFNPERCIQFLEKYTK